jgi:hypothetical protein
MSWPSLYRPAPPCAPLSSRSGGHCRGHRRGVSARVLHLRATWTTSRRAHARHRRRPFLRRDRRGDVLGRSPAPTTPAVPRIRAPTGAAIWFVRGALAVRILAPRMSRLDYPGATGYIEPVAVAERARRQGTPPGWPRASSRDPLHRLRARSHRRQHARASATARSGSSTRRKKEKFGRIKDSASASTHYTRQPTRQPS